MTIPEPVPAAEADRNGEVHDLAIIGGGIAGAAIAREARMRNLSVILFEKNTFGSGTSSRSSKLIHGGLRYLEIAWKALLKCRLGEFWKNLRFVFLALRETHVLARTWPDLIRDIELLLPIYRGSGSSQAETLFGAWFYGILSACHGGRWSRLLTSPEKVLALEPGLKREGLTGGVIVHDYTTDDLALVKRLIEDAREKGAEAWESAEVLGYQCLDGHFQLQVRTADAEETVLARKVINAAGPWVDRVRERGGAADSRMIVPVAGAHLEVPTFTAHSIILRAPDKRIFFIVNRDGNRARIGTTERRDNNPDQVAPKEFEIDYLLRSVRQFFPETGPDSGDILSADAGVRPLARPPRSTSAHEISREHEFVFDEDGSVHVLGVKLTDHRRAAVELLDQLEKR